MPFRCLPSISKSRLTREPPDRHTASNSFFNFDTDISTPTSTLALNTMPPCCKILMRLSSTHFSSLKSGMPYLKIPPILSSRSNITTLWPALFNWSAHAKPAGPEPITAICFPVRTFGRKGLTKPSLKAFSIIASSFSRIVTGSSLIPKTQECSHMAGHILPVISGKLFVAFSNSNALCQCPVNRSSFHSGIKLATGHAQWQKGVPQSIHREAWSPACLSVSSIDISRKSLMRSHTGRYLIDSLFNFKNPLGSPIYASSPVRCLYQAKFFFYLYAFQNSFIFYGHNFNEHFNFFIKII